MTRPWWPCLWVLQEATLARDATFACGKVIPWKSLSVLAKQLTVSLSLHAFRPRSSLKGTAPILHVIRSQLFHNSDSSAIDNRIMVGNSSGAVLFGNLYFVRDLKSLDEVLSLVQGPWVFDTVSLPTAYSLNLCGSLTHLRIDLMAQFTFGVDGNCLKQ
jgi:hypothetical protein